VNETEPDESAIAAEARRVAHIAVTIAASWAATHLLASSKHRLLNMSWNTAVGAVVGRPAHGLSAGVRLADLNLVLVREDTLLRNRPVSGTSPADLVIWLRTTAAALGGRDSRLSLPPYDPPEGFSAATALPVISPDASTRLSTHFARASAILADLHREHDGSTAPRCWPRDFDFTVKIPLAKTPEHHIEVGYGQCEGEPCWGVWPSDETEAPTLRQGMWVEGDRPGAVLLESELPEFGGERAIREWLSSVLPTLLHNG
jgi:hypothetical protein